MTHCSSVRTLVRPALVVATGIAVLALSVQTAPARGREDHGAEIQEAVNPTADALREFQKRLDGYLDLRRSVSSKLKTPSPAADAVELATPQESLAIALRTARRSAKPGDLIPSAAAAAISTTIAADLKRRASAAKFVLGEVPDAPIPTINATYPADAALSTIPPLLLNNLPRLPDVLQYRFYGRHLVILDGDVQIILDYIANVLPRTVR